VLPANVALPRHQHPAAKAFEPGIWSFGMDVGRLKGYFIDFWKDFKRIVVDILVDVCFNFQ